MSYRSFSTFQDMIWYYVAKQLNRADWEQLELGNRHVCWDRDEQKERGSPVCKQNVDSRKHSHGLQKEIQRSHLPTEWDLTLRCTVALLLGRAETEESRTASHHRCKYIGRPQGHSIFRHHSQEPFLLLGLGSGTRHQYRKGAADRCMMRPLRFPRERHSHLAESSEINSRFWGSENKTGSWLPEPGFKFGNMYEDPTKEPITRSGVQS